MRRFHCCVSNAESRQPTPSFWSTSANPRNAWDGKHRDRGKHRFDEAAGRRGKDRREVGHHVNCIPDCGLLKSGVLHRAVPPAPARVPRPQTRSNKPATTGQVRLATGSPPLGTAGGYTPVNGSLVCMCVPNALPLRSCGNLCVHPLARPNKPSYVYL